MIEQNVAQARAVADRLVKLSDVVLAAPVSLNIVCWRFAPASMTPEAQDALNKEILLRVQKSGLAVVSGSRIGGRYVIRVACSNHRSTSDDFEVFLAGVERIRDDVLRGWRAQEVAAAGCVLIRGPPKNRRPLPTLALARHPPNHLVLLLGHGRHR